MNFNYTERAYSNGWTPETIDSFLKYKVAYYFTLDKDFQKRCPLLSYIGLNEEEYCEWVVNSRIHSRVTRIWPMPYYDWTKDE